MCFMKLKVITEYVSPELIDVGEPSTFLNYYCLHGLETL